LGDVPIFAIFAEQFFREQSVGWRQGTRDWTRSIYDAHLIPKFGPLTVSQITRELILEFRVELSEKRTRAGTPALKPKSINTVMRILNAIMTEASLCVRSQATGTARPCRAAKPPARHSAGS